MIILHLNFRKSPIIIMRGDLSFTQGNVVSMILVIVVFMVLLGFGTGTIGGLNDLKKSVCNFDASLPFCGELNTTTQEFQNAKLSVSALSCAINSVSANDPLIGCADGFSGNGGKDVPAAGLLGQLTGFASTVIEDGYEIHQDEVSCLGCGKDERCDDKCFDKLCDGGDIYGCEVQLAELEKVSGVNQCMCRVKIPTQPLLYFDDAGYSWDCVVTTTSDSAGNADLGRVFGSNEEDGKEQCEKLIKDSGIENNGYYLSGKKDELDVTVNNFRLPQKLEGSSRSEVMDVAEESIAQMGDPKYVVYYEIFPEGEDYWNSFSDWYTDAGQALFIALCVSHVLKPIGVLGSAAKNAVLKPISSLKSATGKTKSAISWLGSKLGGSLSLEKGMVTNWWTRRGLASSLAKANFNSEVVGVYTSRFGREAVKNYLDDVVKAGVERNSATYTELQTVFNNMNSQTPLLAKDTQLLAKYLPKEASESVFKSLIKNVDAREAAFKFAAMNGIDIASYYVLRTDSEFGKFIEPHPQSLVLQNTMNEEDLRTSGEEDASLFLREMDIPKADNVLFPNVQNVVDLKKPVLLSREEWLTNDRIKPLVLTSPCRANLKVFNTKEPVRCTVYSYDKDDQMTTCVSPDKEGFIANKAPSQKCGTLQYNMGDEFMDFYDVDGKSLMDIEYDFLQNQMEKTTVFRGDTTISTDPVCCKLTRKVIVTSVDEYSWMQRNSCSLDYWENAGSTEYKTAEILDEGDPDYSSCSQEKKPKSTIDATEIYDPINRITLYYDKERQSMEYYSEEGSSEIKDVPFISLGVIENGNCEYGPPQANDYRPDYGFNESDSLTCIASRVKYKDPSSILSESFTWMNYRVYGKKDEQDPNKMDLSVLEIDYMDGKGGSDYDYTGIVLRDENLNGKIDTLEHNLWSMHTGGSSIGAYIGVQKKGESSFVTDDAGKVVAYTFSGISKDENGEYASATCTIDAVAVEPNLVDVEGEYNYCYQKEYGTTLGIATTMGSFAVSAITKAIKTTKLGGWASWALALAADCGMAYAHYKWNYKWPGTK